MCKEILIWTKQDHLKARQLCRLVPNERSFFSKFPALLSTEQAIHLQQHHPKEYAAFIRQSDAQELPLDPELARQLILQRDLKIKKAKKIEASHHNVQITAPQPPIDPAEYACLFVTKRTSRLNVQEGTKKQAEMEAKAVEGPDNSAHPINLPSKADIPINPDITLPIKCTLKQRAFSMLTQRGFYLTDGSKFGGDFLVYDADPSSSSNHSK